MSDVHVVIKGLAFCRPVSTADGKGYTQILFPHAPNHRLSLSILRVRPLATVIDSVTFNLYRENFMALTLENGASFTTPKDNLGNALPQDLLNLVTLHGEAGHQPTVKLRQRPSVNPDLPISYLSLPTNQLYVNAYSPTNYDLWVKRNSAPPTKTYIRHPNNDHLAIEVRTSFRVPAQSTGGGLPAVKLRVGEFRSDPPPTTPAPFTAFNREYSFIRTPDPTNAANETDFFVILDNHCQGQSSGADFGYYYEMLQGTDDLSSEVEIEAVPSMRVFLPDQDSLAACNPVTGDTGCNLENWYLFLGC